MRAQWQTERTPSSRSAASRKTWSASGPSTEQAERQGDYNKACSLKYGTLVDLERQLKAAEERLTSVQKSTGCWRKRYRRGRR